MQALTHKPLAAPTIRLLVIVLSLTVLAMVLVPDLADAAARWRQ